MDWKRFQSFGNILPPHAPLRPFHPCWNLEAKARVAENRWERKEHHENMMSRLLLSLLLCAPVAPHSPHSPHTPLAIAIQAKLDALLASTGQSRTDYHGHGAEASPSVGQQTQHAPHRQFAAAGPGVVLQRAAAVRRVVAMEQKARQLLLAGLMGITAEDYGLEVDPEPASLAMLSRADIADNSVAAFERVLEVAAGTSSAVLEADPAATAAIALARAFRGLLSSTGETDAPTSANCMAWVVGALDSTTTMAAMAEHLRRYPYPLVPEDILPYLRSIADRAAQCHHYHHRPDLARKVWENATETGKAVLMTCSLCSLCCATLARHRMPRSPF